MPSSSSAPPGPQGQTLSQIGQIRLPFNRDPTCQRCLAHTRNPCMVDPDGTTWQEGDIVILQESIHLPVDGLLAGGQPAKASRLSAGPPTVSSTSPGKQRSAIVWTVIRQEAATEKTPAVMHGKYVLMASYEGLRTYDVLPDVLKLHFAIAVSPHCEICAGDGHLHTTPEWQNPHIWLVAIPFESTAHVAGRWGWKDASRVHQKDKGFVVDEKTRNELYDTFQARLDDWMATCSKQKDYGKRCKEEYDRFKNATLWARYLEARERARKSVDAATSLTAPENALQEDLAGSNTSTRKEGNSGTSSALPPSEPTLAGSASDLEKKDTAGTQALQSAADSTQGNGGTPGADDDGQGPWKTVEPPKKSNKLRKPRQPERQRTVSGIGPMFSEIVGSLKGRTMQSHR